MKKFYYNRTLLIVISIGLFAAPIIAEQSCFVEIVKRDGAKLID